MNNYGAQAKRHWEKWLPKRYRKLSDPETFFEELGEQISSEIRELTWKLAGDDPKGESYLEKVGRLNMARLQAEERVMKETALLDPETDSAETTKDATK